MFLITSLSDVRMRRLPKTKCVDRLSIRNAVGTSYFVVIKRAYRIGSILRRRPASSDRQTIDFSNERRLSTYKEKDLPKNSEFTLTEDDITFLPLGGPPLFFSRLPYVRPNDIQESKKH